MNVRGIVSDWGDRKGWDEYDKGTVISCKTNSSFGEKSLTCNQLQLFKPDDVLLFYINEKIETKRPYPLLNQWNNIENIRTLIIDNVFIKQGLPDSLVPDIIPNIIKLLIQNNALSFKVLHTNGEHYTASFDTDKNVMEDIVSAQFPNLNGFVSIIYNEILKCTLKINISTENSTFVIFYKEEEVYEFEPYKIIRHRKVPHQYSRGKGSRQQLVDTAKSMGLTRTTSCKKDILSARILNVKRTPVKALSKLATQHGIAIPARSNKKDIVMLLSKCRLV